ncbi:hypothetical protein [Paraconexibacter algicola]|uniref:SGNH hydrolase-type esterase domain-containing protein n=1 Tax=Paraconexibacter algicola TaxID=2133960 RepID=A0A2T4UBH3_9ACTN|nr:hypothetical protein [Paraconexibacter algicola]PTL54245.1 hypothetical protein C7Y72_21060 [Paraconexibacter algicola]
MSQVVRTRRRAALAAVALALAGPAAAAPSALAAPGVGTPTVVTVGDSYISGEAGRWAGNSNASESRHDALGADAYWDNATRTGEQIDRCHRSESAEAFIGGGVRGVNLACSGARTATYTDGDGRFKPGLDFFLSGASKGQARMLQETAQADNVKLVVVSIGGNDFDFASIVQTCVTNWATSPTWWKDYCNDDSSVTANFTAANVAAQRLKIRNALLNLRTAMSNAGYSASQYTILVQNYGSPIPAGSGFRYGESGYGRQSTGGCGFWNADANWANATALPTINGAVFGGAADAGLSNLRTLDVSSAFNGRRLCENTVGLVEERGLASWASPGAVDQTEWVNQIRTVSTINSNYFIQESLHPNYWGQLALRACVRLAYNGGTPRSGRCTRAANGLLAGEPRMALG